MSEASSYSDQHRRVVRLIDIGHIGATDVESQWRIDDRAQGSRCDREM